MKKVLACLLTLIMAASVMTACSSPNSDTPASTTASGSDETQAGSGANAGDLKEKELVKLDVMMMSSEKPDTQEIVDKVNEILLEKLNIEMNLTYVAYGNYAQQTTLVLSSGQGADILPVYMIPLSTCANNGQVIPLDDLLAKYGQGLVKEIGQNFIDCGRVGDEVYGITTGRDLAKAYGFEMRKDLCDKYNIDYANIKTLDQLEEALKIIRKNEPNIIPVVPSSGELVRNWGWDTLGDDMTNLGVLMDFGKELTVVNLYETNEYKEFITRMRSWYQEGIIMQDAINNTENSGTLMKAGSAFGGFVNLKPGFDVQETRNYGLPIVVSEIVPAYSTTSDVQMATWTINSGCKNPEAAMKLMNELYTNPDIMNLLIYGIEDKHYKAIGDAANNQKMIDYPEGLDATTTGYRPGGGWIWTNQTIGHVWNGNPADYWDVQKEFNETAVKSKAFGFTYDSIKVKNQVTACTNVVAKYHKALMCGALDPETTLPTFIKELKEAGIDDIIAEKQSQIDKWASDNA